MIKRTPRTARFWWSSKLQKLEFESWDTTFWGYPTLTKKGWTYIYILYIYIYICTYIYTWEGGGRKPAPKAMLMVFFVSALKYLEVKAVATVAVSIPRYFRPDQLQLGRFRPNPGQEPFGARSRAETCWKQFSAIWRPFGRLLHFAFGENGKRLHIQF